MRPFGPDGPAPRAAPAASIADLFPILLFAAALTSCSSEPDGTSPPACTEEFRSWTVTVVDSDGHPVDGLDVEVTRVLTGELLPYGDPSHFAPGEYRIMDDGMAATIRVQGETIRADGSGSEREFRASWEFGADAWRCHVERRSGPDTVIVRAAP